MRVIWFVGGGAETVPGVAKAKEMGLRVAVSDMSPNAPCFAYADEKFIVDTYDVESTVKAALEYNKKNQIDGVMALGSDVPKTVAGVASALGLAGPSIETALLASDKLLMKERFKACGVATPLFAEVKNHGEIKKIADEWGYPLVIKPADSRGARGVLRLTPDVDLAWAFNESKRFSPSGRVLVEEWLEGRQISTESIVYDGDVVTPGLSDRNYELLEKFSPYVIEDGGDLPPALSKKDIDAIEELVKDAATALGVGRWTVKGDVVLTNEGPKMIEMAVRLSGGFFCTHTAPLTTGVDIVGAAIRLALGERLDMRGLRPRVINHVCQRFIFPKPGVIEKIEGVEDAMKSPGVKLVHMYVKPKDELKKVISHPNRGGTVVAVGATRAEALERVREAMERIHVRTIPA